MHVEEATTAQMASILGCQVEGFPQTYLGLALSVTKLKLDNMQPLICRHDRYCLIGLAGS